MKMKLNIGGILKGILKYKYLILVVLVGVVLILLPTGGEAKKPEAREESAGGPPEFSLEAEEERLEDALGRMEGVGNVKVVLSLRGGMERELAYDGEDALIISAGSGAQSAVESRYVYPEYQGAVVVCEGADSPGVQLGVTRAVQSITGLGSDKITILKMKKA